MTRSYYANNIPEFLQDDETLILGHLKQAPYTCLGRLAEERMDKTNPNSKGSPYRT